MIVAFTFGCKEPVFKDSKKVFGNSVEFEFPLDISNPIYDIKVQIRYSYGYGFALEKLIGEIISPSGKKYSAWTLLSAGKAERVGSGLKSLYFQNVKSEKGTFKLLINKRPGLIKLERATLKIYVGEDKND